MAVWKNKNDFKQNQDNPGIKTGLKNNSDKLTRGYKHGSLTEGLIAYYPMEKGQGQIIHDAALNNFGQIKPDSSGGNTVADDMWSAGKIGNSALNFDGMDDHVTFNQSNVLQFGDATTASFTFTCWMKPDSIGRGRLIQIQDGNPFVLLAAWENNEIRWMVEDSDGNRVSTDSGSYVEDTWYHLVGVYDRGKVALYQDGSQVGSSSLSMTGNVDFTKSKPLELGRLPSTDSEYFNGQIDDVRIYNRVLSQPEIRALYNLSQPSGTQKTEKYTPNTKEGGISRYKLNGNTEDAWGDSNGTNNGADLNATGVYGQAATFDGSSHYINIPNDESLNFTGNRTISAWIHPDSLNDGDRVWNNGGPERSEILWEGSVSEIRYSVDDGSTKNGVGTSFSATGKWSHIVGVRDSGTLYLYINGSLRATASDSTGDISSSEDAQIGTNKYYGTPHWHGKIDDLRIYNTALTPIQVEKIFHKGAYRINRGDTLQ